MQLLTHLPIAIESHKYTLTNYSFFILFFSLFCMNKNKITKQKQAQPQITSKNIYVQKYIQINAQTQVNQT